MIEFAQISGTAIAANWGVAGAVLVSMGIGVKYLTARDKAFIAFMETRDKVFEDLFLQSNLALISNSKIIGQNSECLREAIAALGANEELAASVKEQTRLFTRIIDHNLGAK